VDDGTPDGSSLLAQLNDEERSLSTRRTRVQDRIDFLRAGGGTSGDESAVMIEELEREERELSQQRRELHEQIATLRWELRRSSR